MQFCSLKCIAYYYGFNCLDNLDDQYLDEEDEYYASLDDSDEDTIFEEEGDEEEDIDL
jgi:hypothetical protein